MPLSILKVGPISKGSAFFFFFCVEATIAPSHQMATTMGVSPTQFWFERPWRSFLAQGKSLPLHLSYNIAREHRKGRQETPEARCGDATLKPVLTVHQVNLGATCQESQESKKALLFFRLLTYQTSQDLRLFKINSQAFLRTPWARGNNIAPRR